MSLQYNLLTSPSGLNSSALTCDLAQLLVAQDILTPEHFMEFSEQTPQTPAWLIFLQNTDNKESASDIVFEQLGQTNFSWSSVVMDTSTHTRKAEVKTAFEAAFPYCSVDTATRILAQLSSEDKLQLQTNGLLPHRVSLLNALNHRRGDLAQVLLDNGWDLEQTDENGASTLLRAPTWTVAKQLLDCGANILASDHNQSTVWDRVQMWSTHQISSANIIQDIKKRIAPTGVSVAERKRLEAKDAMFYVIAEQKITHLSRRWTTLQTHKNDGEQLSDAAGRSLTRALCEKAMAYNVHEDNKDSLNFFFRVSSFLHDAHRCNGWIDLDQPLEGFNGWTERDHLYTTLTMMMMDGRVNIKSLKETNIWSALNIWHDQRARSLLHDFDQWYQTFNRLDNKQSQDRMYALIKLKETNTHDPWRRLQRFLLTLPEDNPWCQRMLAPFVPIMANIRMGGKWSGGPAYHADWLAQWALNNTVSVDNPVWDILTAKALHTISHEALYRGRPMRHLCAGNYNPDLKVVLDNNLHQHPRNTGILKSWVDQILTPPEPTLGSPTPVSQFERGKAKMDDETLAFFNKIFLELEVGGVSGDVAHRRKM